MKQQIETALQAFSGDDLRPSSIGLLNTLGYQSEKTLDLDNTPDAFLAEFDKRDREFRKDKALEKTRNTKRRELFDAQDAIDAQREELIKNIEKQLKQRRSVRTRFCIWWEVR